MLVDEQPDGVGPRAAVDREPVLALQRKRLALRARDSATDLVLPVRGVDGDFPDVVAVGRRSPLGLGGRDAADRAAERRAMPGASIERLIDWREARRAPMLQRACNLLLIY